MSASAESPIIHAPSSDCLPDQPAAQLSEYLRFRLASKAEPFADHRGKPFLLFEAVPVGFGKPLHVHQAAKTHRHLRVFPQVSRARRGSDVRRRRPYTLNLNSTTSPSRMT